jgi:phospholipase/carboxylesterase
MQKIFTILILLFHFSIISKARIMMPKTLQYVVHEPSVKSANPPVVFLLHGYGSNEQDLLSLHNQLPANYLIISLRAPFTIATDSYKWYDIEMQNGKKNANLLQLNKSKDQIMQTIIYLKKIYHFDSKQIYLGGFSQGGILSYHLGLLLPNQFKGIMVMSGRLLPETKTAILETDAYKKLKIIILHGTTDAMLDISEAREAKQFLTDHKIKFTYKEYNMTHTIIDQEMKDIEAWLKE